MGRNSLSALFYGMCARAIMRLPPAQHMMHLSVGTDMDPPTASRLLADVLSQMASELTAACELDAAMRTLHLCEALCVAQASAEREMAGGEGELRGVQAMHARIKSQIASNVMELRNRAGVAQLVIPRLQCRLGASTSVAVVGSLTIAVSYEAAREHVLAALELTRHQHMDGHLQAREGRAEGLTHVLVSHLTT